MRRPALPLIALMLLGGCTAPPPASEPIITRQFALDPTDQKKSTAATLQALEPHGIVCQGFSGATRRLRTICSGTEREWEQAEPDIARLTAEGVLEDITNNRQPSSAGAR